MWTAVFQHREPCLDLRRTAIRGSLQRHQFFHTVTYRHEVGQELISRQDVRHGRQ
tara:strand:+ start:243 stop:407 length:165 start_codon:yes stop_codon:yes gene_type:complete